VGVKVVGAESQNKNGKGEGSGGAEWEGEVPCLWSE